MPRADKQKNVDRVAASLAKKPLQSEREIAEDTGVSKSSVNRAMKQVGQTGAKDERIKSLTDKDFECIEAWVKEIKRRLTNEDELKKMRATEISQIIKDNTARYTLFRWEVTDEEGGLKETTVNLTELSDKELDERRREILWEI